MACLALKMKSQLLVLLIFDVTVGTFLPTKETSFEKESDDALFSENRGGLRMVTSHNRFHSVLHTASRHTVPRSSSFVNNLINDQSVYNDSNKTVDLKWLLPKRGTTQYLERHSDFVSETKPDAVNNNETSTPRKKTHIIKTRSSNSDTVDGRTASDFVFPIKPTAFIPRQDVKNCSEEGTDLCVSDVSDYPYHHIEMLLKNTTFDFQSYFTDDIITVSTRFDSRTDEELTCDAEETILYPKFGKTAANEILFIINTEEKYRQGIRVEKCRKTGESPCNPKLVTPTGYRTYCKQKYIYRKLLALHPNGEAAPDNFRIPSCCSCYISKETS